MKNIFFSILLLATPFHLATAESSTCSRPRFLSLDSNSLFESKELAPMLQILQELKDENHKIDDLFDQKYSELDDNYSGTISNEKFSELVEKLETERYESKRPYKQAIALGHTLLCEKLAPKIIEFIASYGNDAYILFTRPDGRQVIIDSKNIDWNTLFDLSPGLKGIYSVSSIDESIVHSLNEDYDKALEMQI